MLRAIEGISAERRRWLGLAVLHVLLLVHLGIYYVQPDRTNSTTFKLLAALTVALALAVIGFALWVNESRAAHLRRYVARLRPLFIAAGLLGMLGFGLVMRPEWLYAQIALTVALTLVALDLTAFAGETPFKHAGAWLLLGGGLAILVTAVRIYGLTVYPNIEIYDEPWLLSWGSHFAETGTFDDWIMQNGGHEVHRVYALRGLWLRLVGVGLWEGRLYSLLLTFFPIVFTALAARNLYRTATALFSAGFLFASGILMVTLRIRHDVEITSLVALSLWLHTEAHKRQRNGLHLAAGFAIGLGPFAHYDATFLGIALLAGLYGPRYVQQTRHTGRRWPVPALVYVLGALIGVSLVLVLQILPEWELFTANRQPRHPSDIAQFIDLFTDHIMNIAWFSQIEFILITAGVAAALWRRRLADQSVLIVLMLGHIGLGLLTHAAYDYLIAPLVPFYALLVSSLFSEGLGSPRSEVLSRSRVYLYALLIAANIAFISQRPVEHLRHRRPVHLPVPAPVDWVKAHYPPDTTISAEHYYLFWLTDYDYVSPSAVTLLPDDLDNHYASAEEFWDAQAIDVFIFDPNLATYGLLDPLRRSDYLQTRGYEKAAEFATDGQPIQIYVLPTD